MQTHCLLVVAALCMVWCVGQNNGQQTCSADRQMVDIGPSDADILIGGLFPMREEGQNGIGCGEVTTDTMQAFEAAKYTINFLNGDQSITRGVKFGLKVFDTCSSPSQALHGLVRLFPQSRASNPYCQKSNTETTLGIMGPLTSETAEHVADLAGHMSINVVSSRAENPALSDKVKFPTFSRTNPSSTVMAKAMVALLKKLKWENFLVVYVNDAYGSSAYKELLKSAHTSGLCVSQAIEMKERASLDDYRNMVRGLKVSDFTAAVFLGREEDARLLLEANPYTVSVSGAQWIFSDLDEARTLLSYTAPGALSLKVRSPEVPEFADYFSRLELSPTNNADNPWFEDWYTKYYSCSLRGVGNNQCPTLTQQQARARFVQSPWVVPTMKALFAFAVIVRDVCPTGNCNSLLSLSSSDLNARLRNLAYTFNAAFPITGLRGEKISFDANGDPSTAEYTVVSLGLGDVNAAEIGHYVGGVLTLTQTPVFYGRASTTALNPAPTSRCADVGCDTCLLPQTAVTFLYNPGNVVIASLVSAHERGQSAFACGDPIAERLLALIAAEWAVGDFKRRNSKFQGVSLGSLVADVCPNSFVAESFLSDLLSGDNSLEDSNGQMVSASTVKAFVDQTGNHQATKIHSILSEYHLPEIQTSATTSELSGQKSDYFSRAVPSEKVYFTAIASLLKTLGWQHVQVATRMNGMFDKQTKLFKEVAGMYDICITAYADFEKGMDMVMSSIQSDMSTVVVVIAGVEDLKHLVTQINTQGLTTLQIVSAVEDWNRDPKLLNGINSASDLILFEPEFTSNVEFLLWLQGLSTSEISSHPFLRELFEVSNKCSLIPGTRGVYSRSCTGSDSFSVYQGKTPYIIQSVNLVADKLCDVIDEVCGGANCAGLCPEFHSASDIGQKLQKKIQNSGANPIGFEIKDGEGLTDYLLYSYRNGQYEQIGRFKTSTHQLTSLNQALLNNLGDHSVQCPGACVQCQYLYTLHNYYHTPGDWLLVGAFSVSNSGPAALQPYICGDIRTVNGPQYTTAMMYAIEQVNKGAAPVSVNGVTLGGLAMDHCNNDGRVKLMVSDVFSGLFSPSGVDPTKVLSMITDNTGSTNEAAQLLDPLGVAMVSPSATASSLMDYPTFYRTVQGDKTVATAALKIVEFLNFKYIQVVHSPNDYGREGLSNIQAAAKAEGICVTSALELDVNKVNDAVNSMVNSDTHVVVSVLNTRDTRALLQAVSQNTVARSNLLILMLEPYEALIQELDPNMEHPILSLRLQQSSLTRYNTYLEESPTDNPFFAEYYMKVFNCNLPGSSEYSSACTTPLRPITTSQSHQQDTYVPSTINSVYASVDALDRTLREFCGESYTQPCANFLNAPNWRERYNTLLNSVNFIDEDQDNFRFLERERNVRYKVLQTVSSGGQIAYREVGSYAGVSLSMDGFAVAQYSSVKSVCPEPCLSCVDTGINFSFTPGDIYLAGLFDVHGRSVSPFTCGDLNTLHGYLLLEAFHFALDQVNEKKGMFADILHGTRLGGIGLDGCGSSIRSGNLISNINNGITTLAREGVTIAPTEIDAYIGTYESRNSLYVARILTDLEIAQISYASTSALLDDPNMFPYFFRTVPSDEKIIKAMLAFLDKNNIRYVQVLYEDSSNARKSHELFEKYAASYRVCVSQSVTYPETGEPYAEASNNVVAQLIDMPAANTVVTFLGTEYINSVLQAVGSSPRANGKLRFFGDLSWADNQEAIRSTVDPAIDSLTMKLDAVDYDAFESYISSKTLASSDKTPWFEEYYQTIHECYTSKTNTMGYQRACSPTPLSIINSDKYQQDPGVIHVMNSVYAAAFAIHKSLEHICDENYVTVCQAYRNNNNRRRLIRDELDTVNFTDPTGKQFEFDHRQVNMDFRFFAIVAGPFGGANYIEIGRYNHTTSQTTVSPSYTSKWRSGCDRADACAECPAIRDAGTRYFVYNSSDLSSSGRNIPKDATTVVAFFDIHKQGVDPFRCGDLNMEGFQHFLAFLYSAQELFDHQINGNEDCKGLRLLAIDTCSNSLRIDQDLFGLLQGAGLCNTIEEFEGLKLNLDNLGSVLVVGDTNTMAASRVLESLGVTVVSSSAPNPSLDDKQYLARSNAPTSAKMGALARILKSCLTVDVIYEDTAEGAQPWQAFSHIATQHKIPIGKVTSLSLINIEGDYDEAVNSLSDPADTQVVLLMGSKAFVRRVLASATALLRADSYTWIFVMEESFSEAELATLSPHHLKVIMVRPVTDSVDSYDSYVVNALDSSLKDQEWFQEYFQTVHQCTLPNAIKQINMDKDLCAPNLSFPQSAVTQGETVINTIMAMYAITNGLRDYNQETQDFCARNMLDRHKIRSHILAVDWKLPLDVSLKHNRNIVFKFDQMKRWWDAQYNVETWRIDPMAGVSANYDVLVPSMESQCALRDVAVDRTNSSPIVRMHSQDPRNYYEYDSSNDKKFEWPIWAIAAGVLTTVAIVVTVILFLILLFAYPHRGGTSVLGYMAIVGIILIFGVNFAFFVHASDAACGIRRFFMGIVYMVVFAALLIKAIDNWRFSHVEDTSDRYTGISSPCILACAALGIVLVQCIIPIIWLILVHPTASVKYQADRHDHWWCDPDDDYDLGLVLSMSFVVFIILITSIFSAMAYDSERNNFESRWTLFGCIATAGCFLVWMVVTTNADAPYRDPSVAIANFVNGCILVVILPLRKTILLFRARREHSDEKVVGYPNGGPYYDDSFHNPAFDLGDYDNQYMDG